MKAVVLESFGGPEVLQYKEMVKPEPSFGEVLIQAEKISVNYADIKNRIGRKGEGKFPKILGLDVAGVVVEVGPGVEHIKTGQRVMAFPENGSYAEYVVAKEQLTFVLPDELSFEVAAASPIASFLSYQLLKNVGRIEAGDTVLVHAAAGGVGTTAIQFAKLLGAKTVIGTVGSVEKFPIVRESGADYVCTYEHFSEKVNEWTNRKGVDIILDSVAGKITEESMECLAPYGRLVHFGNTSGTVGNIQTKQLHASCRSVLGFSFGTTRKQRPEIVRQIANKVLPYLANGDITVKIGAEYPLSRAAEAHQLMESRQYTGKILLNIGE